MFSDADAEARQPHDSEPSTHPIAGADGWSFRPFERDEETSEIHITLQRDGDEDETVEMTLPSFVERGEELNEIALIVIKAWERWRDVKGVGG